MCVYILYIDIKQGQNDPLNQIYHIYIDIFKNDKKQANQKKENCLFC